MLTQRCLKSIERNTANRYQLIVIDNGSPLRMNWRADIYCRFKENMGVAYAWNTGIIFAKGEYVALVNNDLEVPKDWDKTLIDKDSQGVGVIKSNEGWSCAVVPKRVFENIGLFDERYFAYFEDIDFEDRLKKEGLNLIQTDLKCSHAKHATGSLLPRANQIYNESERKYREKFGYSPLDKAVKVF